MKCPICKKSDEVVTRPDGPYCLDCGRSVLGPSDATAFSPVGVEARVAADIAARQRVGILKYGTTVADNPLPLREWLEHAYQEALDLPIYLKRAIEEIDQQNTSPCGGIPSASAGCSENESTNTKTT